MDKVIDTPRTDAVKSYEERCEMLHSDKIVTHAMCFARASEEADELHSLCEKLEEELAAQKEQMRVLEEEMLVLGDERNAAVLDAKENMEIANEFKGLMEQYRQRAETAYKQSHIDAERYRWLRSEDAVCLFAATIDDGPINGEFLDAAVDAAMKEMK